MPSPRLKSANINLSPLDHDSSHTSRFDDSVVHRNASSSYSPRSSHKRKESFSEEAIRQLAVPVSVPLVVLCLCWYATSVMSNTLNKSILTNFPHPVTLSMIQFLMTLLLGVSTIFLSQRSAFVRLSLPRGLNTSNGLHAPTSKIILAIAPMGMFQLVGHVFSHMSTSLIPVSLVHTIKALSPLFTVAAYRFLFKVHYKRATYLSLIPLIFGVILTCSVEFKAHFMGVLYALVAALVFVSQNMFAKKLLTNDPSSPPTSSSSSSSSSSPKLDKLNVLCYSSFLAFTFTFPVWFFTEGTSFLQNGLDTAFSWALTSHFLLNGLVHFLQNLLAFQVLGMVTPVTYSIASLIKRIVVIVMSIIWFNQPVSSTQAWGILLTFTGLYLYDRSGGDGAKHYEKNKHPVLPK